MTQMKSNRGCVQAQAPRHNLPVVYSQTSRVDSRTLLMQREMQRAGMRNRGACWRVSEGWVVDLARARDMKQELLDRPGRVAEVTE